MALASSASATQLSPSRRCCCGIWHMSELRPHILPQSAALQPPTCTIRHSRTWGSTEGAGGGPLQPSATQQDMLRASQIHLLVQHQGYPPQLSHPSSKVLCGSGAPGQRGMEPGCLTQPCPRDVPGFKCRIAKLFIKTQKRALRKAAPSEELPASS